MFQVPFYIHQRYQAEARVAEVQYLAAQAILREEEALRARVYQHASRFPYTLGTPHGHYNWYNCALPADGPFIDNLFPYESVYPDYRPAIRHHAHLSTQQHLQPQYSPVEEELKAVKARLKEERLARLVAEEELRRTEQRFKARQGQQARRSVEATATESHPSGIAGPFIKSPVSGHGVESYGPMASNLALVKDHLPQDQIQDTLRALFGVPYPTTRQNSPDIHKQTSPTSPTSYQPSGTASNKAADHESVGNILLEQLKARYKIESDDEIKDTVLAVIDSLFDASAQRPLSQSRDNNKSLIEELRTRSQVGAVEMQLTLDPSEGEFNGLWNPPLPSESSKGKGKGKALSLPSLNVESSLQKVGNIEGVFHHLEDGFTFPAELDFIANFSPLEGSNAFSRLAFTARNHPVRFYEQNLLTLLADLDTIESQGDATLRSKRKETVHLIGQALDALEQQILSRWKAYAAKEKLASSLFKTSVQTLDEIQSPEGDCSTSFTVPILDETSSKIQVPLQQLPIEEEQKIAAVVFDSVTTFRDDADINSQLVIEGTGGPKGDVSKSEQLVSVTTQEDDFTNVLRSRDTHPSPDDPTGLCRSNEVGAEAGRAVLDNYADGDGDTNGPFLLATPESPAIQRNSEDQSPKPRVPEDFGSDWSEL